MRRSPFPPPLALLTCLSILLLAAAHGSAAATDLGLRRAPYLTDLVGRGVTVNWATTTGIPNGWVTYGRLGIEGCGAHAMAATSRTIQVGSTTEYQWRAELTDLSRDAAYCYRVRGGGEDLLGTDPSPSFLTQVPRSSATPFSFAVIGDWGQVDAVGANAAQAAVLAQLASSGARFAVTTGDVGYPDGSQRNYGDLLQTGSDTSGVFGPSFWAVAGDHIPMFNVLGNHGLRPATLVNWPERRAARSSSGTYRMDTYCCVNGTNAREYPSAWYAFDAGSARFYLLDAAWSSGNTGTGSAYGADSAAHWTVEDAEFRWLKHDLKTHPRNPAFAFFHFPLYSPNAIDRSDRFLQGDPPRLEGLLARFGVDIVFNGHAHLYARSGRSARGRPVSYVTGGGGGGLADASRCGAPIVTALGWPASSCGALADPASAWDVYHFLLVTVNGTQVTVTPTNANGDPFDVRTYSFTGAHRRALASIAP